MNIIKNIYKITMEQGITAGAREFSMKIRSIKYKNSIYLNNVHRRYEIIAQSVDKDNIKICFFVSQKQIWNHQSLVEAISKTNGMTADLMIFPDWESKVKSEKETLYDNWLFFSRMGMNVKFGVNPKTGILRNLYNLNYDIVFFEQPGMFYALERRKVHFGILAQKYLLAYIPYGFFVVDMQDGNRSQYNLDFHNLMWRIFCESKWHKKQFATFGRCAGRNVVVSGSPKLDGYGKDATNDIRKKAEGRKVIIWTPHWAFKNVDFSISTFDIYYKSIYEMAAKKTSYYWIVKPHPRLYSWAVEKGLFTSEEMKDYFEAWNRLDNAEVFNEGDYMDVFKQTDLMITDSASFLAEYFPTECPILHLYNEKAKFNSFARVLLKGYYEVYNFEELEYYIDRICVGGFDEKKKYRQMKKKNLMPNDCHTGSFICDKLIEAVGGK